GRWSVKGLLVQRFFPRLIQAEPNELVDETGLVDPHRCWQVAMCNEKPGGHGERAVAMGAIDMALWDLRAKAQRLPLWKLLADRYNGGHASNKVAVYAAGGYYCNGRNIQSIREEMKRYLDMG